MLYTIFLLSSEKFVLIKGIFGESKKGVSMIEPGIFESISTLTVSSDVSVKNYVKTFFSRSLTMALNWVIR